MTDARRKNANWKINTNSGGTVTIPSAQLAVLMDIRDELQTLNQLLHCPHFTRIPFELDAIRRNTDKRKRKK